MSDPIQFDQELCSSVAYYYESQCNDLMAIKEFVVANCTLDDAFGLLLSVMKPQYEEARDKTSGGMDSVIGLLRVQAQGIADYGKEVQEKEDAAASEFDAILARLDALEGASSNSGSGGGYSGGGGSVGGGGSGGSYTGGSGDVSGGVDPGDDVSNDGDDDGDINITITGDNNTVTIGDDGEVVVDGEAEVETPATEDTPATEPTDTTTPATEPTDSTTPATEPTPTGSATPPEPVLDENGLPVDPDVALLDPEVVAYENAQRAELYDRLWEEQAANDPLGRSADELRLAWEAKQPIELDATAAATATVGYSAPAPEPIPANFSMFADANVAAPTLIGAR